jgi:hypothetical protein
MKPKEFHAACGHGDPVRTTNGALDRQSQQHGSIFEGTLENDLKVRSTTVATWPRRT